MLLALSFCNPSLTMKTVPIGLSPKSSGSKLPLYLALLSSVAWCTASCFAFTSTWVPSPLFFSLGLLSVPVQLSIWKKAVSFKVTKFMTVVAFVIAIRLSLGAFISENHCQVSCLSNDALIEVFDILWPEYSLNLLSVSNKLAVVVSKSLCNELSAMTMPIISQRS